MSKIKAVFEQLQQEPVAFIIKGSPDPDAIGSCLALLSYYKTIGGDGLIYHQNLISHSANKTMINVLDIKLTEVDLSTISEKYYVVCDHCDPGIKGLDPANCILHIDHHKDPDDQTDVNCEQFIEFDAGACCSIVARLLSETDFFINGSNVSQVATALVYGIKTDTDNLDGARAKDWDAMKLLSQYYDKTELKKITNIRISTQTADILTRAIKAKRVEQNWLYAGVGYIQEAYRDSIAVVADEMMRMAGVDSVLVYAIIENEKGAVVEGSIRSIDASFDMESFAKNFSDKAGGRKYKGGFQIDLGFWSECPNEKMLEEFVKLTIENKLRSILGTTSKTSKEDNE